MSRLRRDTAPGVTRPDGSKSDLGQRIVAHHACMDKEAKGFKSFHRRNRVRSVRKLDLPRPGVGTWAADWSAKGRCSRWIDLDRRAINTPIRNIVTQWRRLETGAGHVDWCRRTHRRSPSSWLSGATPPLTCLNETPCAPPVFHASQIFYIVFAPCSNADVKIISVCTNSSIAP